MKKRGLFRRSSAGGFDPPPYDPATQYAVIRSSVCTGEKVAGFKDKKTGRFTEVMLIRTPQDEQTFRQTYHIDTLRVEY